MRMGSRHQRRGGFAAVATALLFASTTGCQASDADQLVTQVDEGSATTGRPESTRAPLPDVCTLLSTAEVIALTGVPTILSVDPDGVTPNSDVRVCQWQLSGARLLVQLYRTTAARFAEDHAGAEPVSGLGDEAVFNSNHLFVRQGLIQVDVYASTAKGVTADRQLAKDAAAKVIPRLDRA